MADAPPARGGQGAPRPGGEIAGQWTLKGPPAAPRFLESDRKSTSPPILRAARRPLVQASCASFFVQCLVVGCPPSPCCSSSTGSSSTVPTKRSMSLRSGVVLAGGFEFLFARARERLLGRAAADAWTTLMERVYRHLLYTAARSPGAGGVRGARIRGGGADSHFRRPSGRGSRHGRRSRGGLHLVPAAGGREARPHRDFRDSDLRTHRPRHPAGGAAANAPGLGGGAEMWGFVHRVNETGGEFRDGPFELALENGLERRWRERSVRESVGSAGRGAQTLGRHRQRHGARAASAVPRPSSGTAPGSWWPRKSPSDSSSPSTSSRCGFSAPIIRASRVWPDIQRTRDAVRRIESLFREDLDSDAGKTALTKRPAGRDPVPGRDRAVSRRARPRPRGSRLPYRPRRVRRARRRFRSGGRAPSSGPCSDCAVRTGGRCSSTACPSRRLTVRRSDRWSESFTQHAALFTGHRLRQHRARRPEGTAGGRGAVGRARRGVRIHRTASRRLPVVRRGERGRALSGGQRQRIALASRARPQPGDSRAGRGDERSRLREEEASFFERIERARGARTVLCRHPSARRGGRERPHPRSRRRASRRGRHPRRAGSRPEGSTARCGRGWLPPGLLQCA